MLDVGRPGDERAFLHKKIFGGISRIADVAAGIGIPGARIVSSITGRVAGGPRPPARRSFGRGRTPPPPPIQIIPQTFAPEITPTTFPGQPFHGNGNGGGGSEACPPPLRRSPAGNCIFPGSPRGAEVFRGEVIAGQYGAGFVAGSRIVDVATCTRGTVLGKDGICYANLANKNRLYPRGRRPLLTGGDMRAISRARTAGNRLANAKQDLLAIGMLKAAGPRKRRKKTVPTC